MKHKYLDNVTTLKLIDDRCTGCGICAAVCPHGVFRMQNSAAVVADKNRCMECGACANNCAAHAISVEASVGCAAAVIRGWFTGSEPSCDCSGGGDCC